MIGFLRGTLHAIDTDRIVLDVGGVGYLVRVSLNTYWELERLGPGAEAGLRIHTHVREDTLDLFGFVEQSEQLLFERLIGVSGIGPRLAQVVLSGMPPEELLAALAEGNVPRLVRIPGVGKKTAERMVLELRDGAAELVAVETGERHAPEPSVGEDVAAALVNLGYRAKEAERAVAAVLEGEGELDFQDLLRRSLKRLSKV